MILSAGESSRMGAPKALLEYGGSTFISRLVRMFRAWTEETVIVLGHDAERIRAAAGDTRTVVNPDYRRGMLTSLQCGLRAAPEGAARFLFTLVDVPAVAPSTVAAIACASGEVVIPRYRGRSGHPVAFGQDVARELLELPETGTAKDVLKMAEARIVYLDLDDPEIVNDIDTPADYQALLARKSAEVV